MNGNRRFRSPVEALLWVLSKDTADLLRTALTAFVLGSIGTYLCIVIFSTSTKHNLRYIQALWALWVPIILSADAYLDSWDSVFGRTKVASHPFLHLLPLRDHVPIALWMSTASIVTAAVVLLFSVVHRSILGIEIPILSSAVIAAVVPVLYLTFYLSRILFPLFLPFAIYAVVVIISSYSYDGDRLPPTLSSLDKILMLGIIPVCGSIAVAGLTLDRREIGPGTVPLPTLLRFPNFLPMRLSRAPSSPQRALLWYECKQRRMLWGNLSFAWLTTPFVAVIYICLREGTILPVFILGLPIIALASLAASVRPIDPMRPFMTVFERTRPVSYLLMARAHLATEHLVTLALWILAALLLLCLRLLSHRLGTSEVFQEAAAFVYGSHKAQYWAVMAIPMSSSVRFIIDDLVLSIQSPAAAIGCLAMFVLLITAILLEVLAAKAFGTLYPFNAAGWWFVAACFALYASMPARRAVRLGLIPARRIWNSTLFWFTVGLSWFLLVCLIVPFKEQPRCSIPLHLILVALTIQAVPRYALIIRKQRHL